MICKQTLAEMLIAYGRFVFRTVDAEVRAA
jgi:hypothetical protein